jgi:hypothetical protein
VKDSDTPVAAAIDRWLLLIHQLPAKPAYLRVKVWRRLQAFGAVLVKNTVYVLPATEQAQEDFEWLLKEITEGGGEAMIWEARLVNGFTDEEVRSLFNGAREADYREWAKEARAVVETLGGDTITPAAQAEARPKLARLKTSLQQIVAIDFFGADGREMVEGLLTMLESLLKEGETMTTGDGQPLAEADNLGQLKGQVWVTRQGVHVDRIASAWLIHRFIDPDARFKFVPGKAYVPQSDELRFDMFDGEFSHEGDRCTFEVLVGRAGLIDPALAAIAEIVHDIDLKDGKFGREETGGIAHLIDGLSVSHKTDEQRVKRGAAIFDDLYEYFRRKKRPP